MWEPRDLPSGEIGACMQDGVLLLDKNEDVKEITSFEAIEHLTPRRAWHLLITYINVVTYNLVEGRSHQNSF